MHIIKTIYDVGSREIEQQRGVWKNKERNK